jgi:hypothetical protein
MDFVYVHERPESKLAVIEDHNKYIIRIRNAYGTEIVKTLDKKEAQEFAERLSNFVLE